MRQVQHTIGDAGRRAVGVNVVQPHGDLRLRLVASEGQRDPWSTNDVHVLIQCCAVEGRRERIVAALIPRRFGAQPDRAIFT